MDEKLKPTEWIDSGELDPKGIKNAGDIIGQCACLLDGACATEIVGPVLFKASDGKWYTVVVEAEIIEASKEFVEDALYEMRLEQE